MTFYIFKPDGSIEELDTAMLPPDQPEGTIAYIPGMTPDTALGKEHGQWRIRKTNIGMWQQLAKDDVPDAIKVKVLLLT